MQTKRKGRPKEIAPLFVASLIDEKHFAAYVYRASARLTMSSGRRLFLLSYQLANQKVVSCIVQPDCLSCDFVSTLKSKLCISVCVINVYSLCFLWNTFSGRRMVLPVKFNLTGILNNRETMAIWILGHDSVSFANFVARFSFFVLYWRQHVAPALLRM